MVKKINIDLSSVKTKNDLFQIFAISFGFPEYFGKNWDAFFELMYSLDLGSFLKSEDISGVTGIHLVFLNFDIFRSSFSEEDMGVFSTILVELSANKQYRGDHLAFTFELAYSGLYGG